MARRFVAFLDVLGFKSLVETVPHAQLVDIYRGLQEAAQRSTTTPVFPNDHRRFDSDPYFEPDEVTRHQVANVVLASDSIVVYSRGDSYKDALPVASAVSRLLLAGFRAGVPLRGGLAIGEIEELDLPASAQGQGFTARFGGLVGLGLVRAYELEAQHDWSGATLHPELVDYLRELPVEGDEMSALDLLCASLWVVETDVPLKPASEEAEVETRRQWVIAWPLRMLGEEPPLQQAEVEAAFESFGRTPAASATARKKENTLGFLDRAQEDHSRSFDAIRERLR